MLNILGLLFLIEEFGFIYMLSDMHATKNLVTFHESGISETPNSLEYSHFIEYVVQKACTSGRSSSACSLPRQGACP